MKKILITSFIFIIIFIYFVPEYNELNNLTIIDAIGVEKIDDSYNVYFREIIPKKDENGIKYTYKIYNVKTSNLSKSKKILEEKEKKKLYLNKIKIIYTNISSDYIKKTFNINTKIIYHTNNIKKKLSK